MKTLLTTITLIFSLMLSAYSQDNSAAYQQAMGQALAQWPQAESPADQQALLNTFDRIAAAQPDAWQPAYYAALLRLNKAIALPAGPEQDALLEQVQEQVEAQLAQHPDNSELLALLGYRHMMYVAANPMARGQRYSGLAIGTLMQAIAIDPANPRAHMLLGQMKLGMARFMNSPTDEACALLGKAVSLYEAGAAEEPGLDPQWGRGAAIEAAAQCAASN